MINVTVKASAVLSVVFALLCFGFAINGLMSTGEITDPQQAADARGFAWFWMFLGAVAVLTGALSWWIVRGRSGENG